MAQRVLVVEDSPVIQRLIDMTLKAGGFEVEFSDSGPDGLEKARTCSHDVVVLDIGLPGLDGWQVLEALRAEEATKSLPVIVLTAHGRARVQDEADSKGANLALSKPFNPVDFRAAVASLLPAA
ncbi:MAG: response regulator [bacterium]|nr:response regulator [bacterium]